MYLGIQPTNNQCKHRLYHASYLINPHLMTHTLMDITFF